MRTTNTWRGRGGWGAMMAAGVLVAVPSCFEIGPGPGVVAKVGTVEITEKQVAKEMARQEAADGQAPGREVALQTLIEHYALRERARKRGLDLDTEVRSAYDAILVEALFKEAGFELATAADISNEEVGNYYRAHADEFALPESRHLAVIDLDPVVAADAAAAADLRERMLARGADEFTQVASRFSRDEGTRHRGGDIGWVKRDKFPARFPQEAARAAFALDEDGAISAPVVADGKILLVKRISAEPATVRPLAEVRDEIHERLTAEKRAAQLEEFRQDSIKTVPTVRAPAG